MAKDPSRDRKIIGKDESGQEETSAQEESYLNTFPLIRRIASRKLGISHFDSIEDITQRVMLKLWNWRKNKNGPELSQEDWSKLANTAAHNEINTFYSQKLHKEIPLVLDSENDGEGFLEDRAARLKIEGNTDAEVASLLIVIWQNLPKLSIRQKYAILLQGRELTTYLISNNCCSIKELANSLGMSFEEFAEVARSMPISDPEICGLFKAKTGEAINEKQLWEARNKGKARMLTELKKIGIR